MKSKVRKEIINDTMSAIIERVLNRTLNETDLDIVNKYMTEGVENLLIEFTQLKDNKSKYLEIIEGFVGWFLPTFVGITEVSSLSIDTCKALSGADIDDLLSAQNNERLELFQSIGIFSVHKSAINNAN